MPALPRVNSRLRIIVDKVNANRIISAALVLAFLPVLIRTGTSPGSSGWPEIVFLIVATISALATLGTQLPAQNVLLAALTIGLIGGMTHIFQGIVRMPYDPEYEPVWLVSILWIVVILTARGVAQWILRAQWGTANYGLRLMALTATLSVVLDFGLEPFATQVKHYWSAGGFIFGIIPELHYVIWFGSSLLILALATPALIRKKPGAPPISARPLLLWFMLNVLFGVGGLAEKLWLTAGVSVLAAVAVAVCGIKRATDETQRNVA
jgi:uncharacterized membrane protein